MDADGEPDVAIRHGSVSIPPGEVEGGQYSARWLVEGGQIKVVVLGVARYSATGGSVIRVDPDPGAKTEDLLLYLAGPAMGAVLHQRGVFPLHASCVAIDGKGIAFAGPSGAGKSTLLAALVRHGATFVSDDTCVLVPVPGGGVAVWPGAPRAKLDRAALSALAHSVSGLEPAGGPRAKFHLQVDRPEAAATPVPLHRVYLLRDGEGAPRSEALTGLEAVAALVEETYFLGSAAALKLNEQCFRLAANAARTVQVRRLVRAHGLQHLNDVVGLIDTETRRC